jgi:uncharacterized protein
MKLLVISDTHGNYPMALQAEEAAGDIDAIIHLGDGVNDAILISQALDTEVRIVAGNCDLAASAPREQLLEYGGKRLLLTHGDRYSVKHGMDRLFKHGLEAGADVILYGHTHIASINTKSDILMVNPGTLSQTSHKKTFAVLEINSGTVSATIHEIEQNFP